MKITELFPDIITEDRECEFKAVLNPNNPVKWAKTLVGFANGDGGILFVGVSDNREAFGLDLQEIDRTKNLIAVINDRNIFPHVKLKYMIRSVDDSAEHFVLAISVAVSESVVRYREGDFNEKVYVKGDANSMPASPEDIISLAKRKHGVDNETTEVKYLEEEWREFANLCRDFRSDHAIPGVKELQNEEILSQDGYAKSGFLMFKDDYASDDTLICCRLWRGRTKSGEVLDSERIKGSISSVFYGTLSFIERNTKTGWRKSASGGREEIRSYPREAIREALVNAIAHRDYAIAGTQIDVDIYCDRIDIVSPGSWLLPRPYEQYPIGTIPSIRRNTIIAACLDVANLMERGGTGFQTMADSYRDCELAKQPGVMIYPGFLTLRLFDKLYEESGNYEEMTEQERIVSVLRESPMPVKELQSKTHYKSRAQFLNEVINPLMEEGVIYRAGNAKSPTAVMKLRKD